MGSGTRGSAILRWRGALAEGTTHLRRVVAGMLALSCVTLAFTQWGFIGLQFSNGSSAYLILMLVPVTLAALLLGTVAGASMGLVSGVTLYLHSIVMPLDYYELTFVTPVTSAIMMAVGGLVAGALFAVAARRSGWRRVALVALACLAASWVFSLGFAAGTIAVLVEAVVRVGGANDDALQLIARQATMVALVAGDASFQAFADAAIMAASGLIALSCAERGMREAEGLGLRAVFGVRLSAVVLAAFMLTATVAYVAITAGERADAAVDMRAEVDYLLGQVERTAEYNGEVVDLMLERTGGAPLDADTLAEMTSGGLLGNLIAGYTEEGDGLVVVALGEYLIGTDAERLADAELLPDAFGDDILAAAGRSREDGTLERVVYVGPGSASDLVDLALPGAAREEFSTMLTRQVGYLAATEHDDYQVIMIRPASMVFAGRGETMGWVTLSSLVTLASVFALAWTLLERLVARRVDATNATLAAITAGELDARVEPAGTREFLELSAGVNATVDALQGWIAEAERRMDAELATAKAIQESALPQVFPPYPDIPRFDIYASMNAAKEVGGDFYDLFLVGDDCTPAAGRLAFVIADVSGKGVPAALFMMKAKTQIRDYLESGMELGEAVENANRQLCDGNDAGMFVTAWVGVLDYASGRVDFVNAGHNPPLLRQDGGWRWLKERSGLPLGLFDGLPYKTHSVDCGVGDQLLLYTDGVTEAFSVDDEQYGEERLERLAGECRALRPRELVGRVRRDVAKFAEGAEQSDDITVLALEVGVPPEEGAQIVVPADVDELAQVNDLIHSELDRRLCPVRAQGQLDIAVEELFVNVCRYAYEGADAGVERSVRVTLSFSADPPSVTVEIVDAGRAFDPLAKPDARRASEYASVEELPIGGLGILMAKRNVDELRYERAGGLNVVTLVKRW